MRMQEPEIVWTIPIDKANMILSILGNEKFHVVADLIMDLRSQAGAQLQRMQQGPMPQMQMTKQDQFIPPLPKMGNGEDRLPPD